MGPDHGQLEPGDDSGPDGDDGLDVPGGPIDQVQADDQRQVMAHEIGHLLTMSNAHAEHGLMSDWASEDVIDEALLERVCSKRHCGCFNPES